MIAISCFWQYGKQLVLGVLIEDVVDDLHRVDEPAVERAQHVGRLPAIDADAERADQAFVLERAQRPLPAIVGRPVVVPDVELLEVERRDADVLEALLGVLADVVGREDVVERVRGCAGHLRFFGGILVAM